MQRESASSHDHRDDAGLNKAKRRPAWAKSAACTLLETGWRRALSFMCSRSVRAAVEPVETVVENVRAAPISRLRFSASSNLRSKRMA